MPDRGVSPSRRRRLGILLPNSPPPAVQRCSDARHARLPPRARRKRAAVRRGVSRLDVDLLEGAIPRRLRAVVRRVHRQPAGRRRLQGDGRPARRARGARHRPRRRGDRADAHVHRPRQRDRARGSHAGLRRLPSRHLAGGPGRRPPSHHPADPGDHGRAPLRSPVRHGRDHGDREGSPAPRDRGLRRGLRGEVQGAARRHLRRRGDLQLLRQQDDHHRRGGAWS